MSSIYFNIPGHELTSQFFLEKRVRFSYQKNWRFDAHSCLTASPRTIVEPYSGIFSGNNIPSIGSFSYTWSELHPNQRIGRYSNIGPNVSNMGVKHPKTWPSTSFYYIDDNPIYHDAHADLARDAYTFQADISALAFHGTPDQEAYEPARIENDVWIGDGALLARNITIATGAIVGACAVVTRDVPPYAIVAGNPAKITGHRFNEALIDRFLKSEWWKYAFPCFSGMNRKSPEIFLDEFEASRDAGNLSLLPNSSRPLVLEYQSYVTTRTLDIERVKSKVNELIAPFMASNSPVLVCPAGIHAQWLMGNTLLPMLNIVAFADGDINKHGHNLFGAPIIPYSAIGDTGVKAVFITSEKFAGDIIKSLGSINIDGVFDVVELY